MSQQPSDDTAQLSKEDISNPNGTAAGVVGTGLRQTAHQTIPSQSMSCLQPFLSTCLLADRTGSTTRGGHQCEQIRSWRKTFTAVAPTKPLGAELIGKSCGDGHCGEGLPFVKGLPAQNAAARQNCLPKVAQIVSGRLLSESAAQRGEPVSSSIETEVSQQVEIAVAGAVLRSECDDPGHGAVEWSGHESRQMPELLAVEKILKPDDNVMDSATNASENSKVWADVSQVIDDKQASSVEEVPQLDVDSTKVDGGGNGVIDAVKIAVLDANSNHATEEAANTKWANVSDGMEDRAPLAEAPAKLKDDWDVIIAEDSGKGWSEMSTGEQACTIIIGLLKFCSVLGLLYLFIVSLSIMGSAFKVLAGPTAGQVFRNSHIFDNPIAGLVVGVLATVLVQSSSTSTSIIITMTASDLMKVKNAIFMVMGANIGTSVTNTIVSVFQIGDKDQYRRAFAGATVHDCFNILTVCILLPLEAVTGVLMHLSEGIVGDKDFEKGEKQDFLKKITKPLTSRIVEVDKKLVEKVAQAEEGPELDKLLKHSMFKNKVDTGNHLFLDTPLNDTLGGLILLVVSLIVLSTCLILLVKVLQSVFRGRMATGMNWLLNLEFKAVPFVADYILIIFGMIITILMQSSSVTTSTLTPLVGIGIVRLEKMFCFTVGANIGTTCTGLISAAASSNINTGLKVALAHLNFNIIGTLLWFPVPLVRAIPLNMAKSLGCVAADWKWFPLAYISVVFGLLPGMLLVFSLIHWAVLVGFLVLFVPVTFGAMLTLVLRQRYPQRLPPWMLQDPKVGGHCLLPPCLMVDPPAQMDSETAHPSGEAKTVAKRGRNLDPLLWGPKWFAISMLLLTVFNSKWADIKYAPRHDNRHHFGIGAYKTCSNAFEKEAEWAMVPVDTASCEAFFSTCATEFKNCTLEDGFADADGRDEAYWELMFSCTKRCSLPDWESACISLACTGSKHAAQCKNVSEQASAEYSLQYVSDSSFPWKAGDKCREPSLLCSNDAAIRNCGTLAVAAMVILFLSQLLLFSRFLLGKERERKALSVVCTMDMVAWLLLLVSWSNFVGIRGDDAVCTVAVPGNHGYAQVQATFGDIINGGGSYTFYVTVFCWTVLLFSYGAVAILGRGWRLCSISRFKAKWAKIALKQEAGILETLAP